jgi:uncharacterized RDD family membrane protein YckC
MSAGETPTPSIRYSVRWHGEVRGPFPAAEVQALFLRGQITRFHQVSADGSPWRQLKDWPDLLPPTEVVAVEPAPAAPPAGAVGLRPIAVARSTAEMPAPVAATAGEWYLDCAGRSAGPFALVDLRAMLASGQFPQATLARKGVAGEWRALPEFPELAGGLTTGLPQRPDGLAGQAAGFGRRCAAALLDGVVAGLANGCVLVAMSLAGRSLSVLPARGIAVAVVLEVYCAWLYCSLAESSSRQGTLGKMALGLRVTDEQGCRLSLGRASARFVAKLVSALTLGIGFLAAAFSARGQALHDRLAGTLVLR